MKKRIISDPEILSGAPVFRGTRIPLSQVAGLLRGGTPLTEIAEDYPALSRQDLAFARVYVRLTPAPAESASVQPIQLRRKQRAA